MTQSLKLVNFASFDNIETVTICNALEASERSGALLFYTSLSRINGLTCLRSERMMLDLENLESVAPNEEQMIITATNRCIIVVYFLQRYVIELYYTNSNCILPRT